MKKVVFRPQTATVEINSTQGRNFKHTGSTVGVSLGIPMVAVTHWAVWKETSLR